MTKLQIDEVIKKGEVYPTIVNFLNGYATASVKNTECHLFRDQTTGEKCLFTEIDNLVYAGKESQEEAGKTFILARNRVTGKVRLIEVGTADLKTVVQREKNTTPVEPTALDLARKFGSKKRNKVMEQREKMRGNVELVEKQMKEVTANTTVDQVDLDEYIKTDTEDFYIPPMNRTPDKVENVYDLDKILKPNQYTKIINELSATDNIESQYHPFIKSMVSGKDLTDQEKVLAMYASVLFTQYVMPIREITRKTYVAVKSSKTLCDIVMNNFFDIVNNKPMRPQMYKDKALYHAIVFALLLNNYKLDIDELSKQVKISAKTLMTKARVTGATFVKQGNKKILQLKLPLANTGLANRRKSAKF